METKTILLTGSRGMFGVDSIPILKSAGFTIIETDVDNLDITNKEAVESFLDKNKCDYILHAAAYTNVELAESEKEKAFLINEKGTLNIALKASALDIPIIYISTDYIFDGKKNTPYEPEDKPNPLNVYGKSKLMGEKAVIENTSKYYIARTSWLYGLTGKNFVNTMLNLAKTNTELKIVNDQTGCPSFTVDLIKAIIFLLENNFDYGIYHLCGSGSASWYEFASKIFELYNIDINLKAVPSSEFNQKALRPKYSVMNNQNLCPNWLDALKEYKKLKETN